jgi:long-subunit fatty acid transport protein
MTRITRYGALVCFAVGPLAIPQGMVQASGYHFGSQSVSAQGTAHSNGAEAADASTIFYNPAGLARLKGTQVTSGISILLPDGKYKDTGSTDVFGQSVEGDAGSFLPDAAAAPNLYFSRLLVPSSITRKIGPDAMASSRRAWKPSISTRASPFV